MSIKSAIIGMLMFFGAIGLAYMLQLQSGGEVYSKRNPSSDEAIHLRNMKQEVLNHRHHPNHVHTEKLRAPIRLKFQGEAEESKGSSSQMLTLKIEAEQSFDELNIEWILPEGVRLLSGQLEEQISIQRGETKELVIFYQPLNQSNHQIHVHVSNHRSGLEFTQVAQYNTLFESYLNAEPENLEKLSASEDTPKIEFTILE